MRTLRKRIVCRNRNDSDKNYQAIMNVQNRYVEKMKKKGWYFFNHGTAGGNVFFYYEHYITLLKPYSISDLDYIAQCEIDLLINNQLHDDIKNCRITKNGIRVMLALKKLGWIEKSYAKKLKHSNIFYDCGYRGCYNFSRLVKVF